MPARRLPAGGITVEGCKGRGLWNQLRMLAEPPARLRAVARGCCASLPARPGDRPRQLRGRAGGPGGLADAACPSPCASRTRCPASPTGSWRARGPDLHLLRAHGGGFDPRKVVCDRATPCAGSSCRPPPAPRTRRDRADTLHGAGDRRQPGGPRASTRPWRRLWAAWNGRNGSTSSTRPVPRTKPWSREAYRRRGFAGAGAGRFSTTWPIPTARPTWSSAARGPRPWPKSPPRQGRHLRALSRHAADDHQRLNAGHLVAAGAAEMIAEARADRRAHAGRTHRLTGLADREALARMSANARTARPARRRRAHRGRLRGALCAGERATRPTGQGLTHHVPQTLPHPLRRHRRHRHERHRRGAAQPRLQGVRLGPARPREITARLDEPGRAHLRWATRADQRRGRARGRGLLGGAARQPRGAWPRARSASRSSRAPRCWPS